MIYITRLIFPHQVVIASLQCSSQVSKTDIQVLIDPITYILIKKFVKQSNGVSVQLRACSDSFHLATMVEKMDAMVVNASDAIFSSDLSWSAHYNAISTKAYQTLGLIRRTFKINCTEAKKQQYLALVRSQLLCCSQLWIPELIRDISILECVQRRATKYILNDYTSSYKQRLEKLNLLPLMHHYELQDIMFLIKSLKSPSDNFNIDRYINFASRSRTNQKLIHSKSSSTVQQHFYFKRMARLYNHLLVIDLSPFSYQYNQTSLDKLFLVTF